MTRLQNQSARRIADKNHAAKRRAVNGTTKRAKRLLKKVTSLERQVEQAVARADNCNAKFINAHKRSVKRSVHNKMKMPANVALQIVTVEKMKVDERSKRLQKALAYCEKIYDHR